MHVCVRPTVEEVALALKYLGDLKGPDLTHPWVGGVEDIGLRGTVGQARSQHELTGITFNVLLQTQTAYLKGEKAGISENGKIMTNLIFYCYVIEQLWYDR